MNSELGDFVWIHHRRGLEDTTENPKQYLITAIKADLQQHVVHLAGVSVGDSIGPVSWTGETTTSLTPSLDTYVSQPNPTTSYGTSTSFIHGNGTLGRIRTAIRFDPSSIATSDTVSAAVLQIYCTGYTNRSALRLRQLNSTDWSNSSTYNSFDSGGAWSESNIGGTNLSDNTSALSAGWNSKQLNSSGISYLQTQIAAAGNIEFTFASLNNGETYTMASSESSYPAKLIITSVGS